MDVIRSAYYLGAKRTFVLTEDLIHLNFVYTP